MNPKQRKERANLELGDVGEEHEAEHGHELRRAAAENVERLAAQPHKVLAVSKRKGLEGTEQGRSWKGANANLKVGGGLVTFVDDVDHV